MHSCHVDDSTQFVQTIPEETYIEANALIRTAGIGASQLYADSVYNRLDAPTPVDYWRKRIHDTYINNLRGAHGRSIEILDSLIMYIEDPARYASMQNQLASTYLYKGDTYNMYLYQNDLAYQNYVRARMIGLNLEDKCLISAYDSRFAGVLYWRENYLDAVDYFKMAISNYEGCHTAVAMFDRMQRWIDDIAISYAKAGIYDSAMVYHTKALDFIDQNRFTSEVDSTQVDLAKAVIWGNMAQTLVALGRDDEAEPLFKRSIEINSGEGFDNNDASLTRLHLANMLIRRGDFHEAEALINAAESYTEIDPNPSTLVRLLETRSQFRQSRGEYRLALEDRLLHDHLEDSLSRANTMVFNADASSEYNYLLAQQEVERLKAANQIRTTWITAGSITIILFCIVLFLVYYAWRQSNRSNKLLKELNAEIGRQKIELESTVKQLKDASTEKDRIMWMVAHDLRNPLGAIENLAQFLQMDSLTDDSEEIISQISFAASSALRFTTDILAVADEGRMTIDVRSTDINELLHRTIEMMQYKAREKGQNLIFDGPGHEKQVRIDPEKITRAVVNLIGNAVKFSPNGAEIVVVLSVMDDKLTISVIDRGMGVPTDMREAIFESFTKAKRPGTGGEKPYGLGLSIAKSIVTAHKGKVELYDTPGGGSTFTIELPVS